MPAARPAAGRPRAPGQLSARRATRRPPARKPGIRRASSSRRLQASLGCVAFALSLVAGRLVQLQGLDGAAYRALANKSRLQVTRIPAERGSITTADGTTLAMTVQEDTVTADPPQLTGISARATAAMRQRVAGILAGPLHMTASAIVGKLDHPPRISPDYVLLAQGVPAPAASRIEAVLTKDNLAGIYFKPTYARSYPNGDLASNVVGFTTATGPGNDLAGQAGIEQSFNTLLSGRDGREEAETGIDGQPIPFTSSKIRPLVPGGGVRLTILASLQYEAQQACEEQVKKNNADSCTIVVEQPGTGKILAMAQYPTFDPANVTSYSSTLDTPFSSVFPPGSTAKVITAAAALEHGQTPMTPYTVPENILVDGIYPFHDADPHPTERLTLAGILAHSSNVGMVQVAENVSPQVQYHYLRAFGLGEPTGLPLPNPSDGLLPPPSKWWGDQRYTLAFGQGVAATAVQMAGAYATIANGGVRVSPSIVAGTTKPSGAFVPAPPPHRQRVIRASTAHELTGILQQVPYLDATLAYQPWGVIPGYSVASKTGTAQVWDARAHCLCQYGSSYIGMAPASDPKVVVAVNIQNPRKADYFGNYVAGPAFYHVMKFALQTLKIPPDGGKRPNVRLTAP
jgi:cell division protein FtsI (penicillin-binding protein 3)